MIHMPRILSNRGKKNIRIIQYNLAFILNIKLAFKSKTVFARVRRIRNFLYISDFIKSSK